MTTRALLSIIARGLTAATILMPGHGSSSGAQTVFKSRTDLVRVNVGVLDTKTGKPVTGLTARDFTILENGVAQTISVFAADGAPSGTTPDSGQAGAHDRRVFLLVLSFGRRQEGPVHPLEGVIHFLRERLRPGDLAAVMAFNRVTPFTTDHEQLARRVEQLQPRWNALGLELSQDAERRRAKKVDLSPAVQADIDALFGSGVDAARSVPNLLLATSQFRENDDQWHAWNGRVIGSTPLKMYAGIEYLRGQPGDKHLICLTEGLFSGKTLLGIMRGEFIDSHEDDSRLAARANDAHVTLDIIQTSGVDTGFFQSFSIMAGENVAGESGGQFTGVKTADAALAGIDETTRHGYVLGFMPSNPALDGKYRNIVVKVNRPGVTMLFPRGYTAQPDVPPLPLREIVTRERLRDAMATDVLQDEIKIQAKATLVHPPFAVGAAAQVKVEMTIDVSRLSFATRGGTHDATLDIMIACGDARQQPVGELTQQMAMTLDEDRYRQAMIRGLPYVVTVPVTNAATVVKLLVYHYDTDALGSVVVTIKPDGGRIFRPGEAR